MYAAFLGEQSCALCSAFCRAIAYKSNTPYLSKSGRRKDESEKKERHSPGVRKGLDNWWERISSVTL